MQQRLNTSKIAKLTSTRQSLKKSSTWLLLKCAEVFQNLKRTFKSLALSKMSTWTMQSREWRKRRESLQDRSRTSAMPRPSTKSRRPRSSLTLPARSVSADALSLWWISRQPRPKSTSKDRKMY